MNSALTSGQKSLAIQRVTALWAFSESGLGGVLHAFHIPVTGLVLGSMSVICICLIASFSKGNYQSILKSLLVVLIVKAVVSPQTPFPAYIACSFQGLFAFLLFSVSGLNFISILLVAVLTMLESALQKLLLVTLFFGRSFWTGLNDMVSFITKPIGINVEDGSYWIIGIYLSVYVTGGIVTAWIANRLIEKLRTVPVGNVNYKIDEMNAKPVRKKMFRWKHIILILWLIILGFSFFYTGDASSILRSVVWTLSAVSIWYIVIVPVITSFLKKLLMNSGHSYKKQASEIISFIPVMRTLSVNAWAAAGGTSLLKRIPSFLTLLITSILTFRNHSAVKEP